MTKRLSEVYWIRKEGRAVSPRYRQSTLINHSVLASVMGKVFTIIRSLIRGEASIDYIDKTSISRTPGEVTEEVGHN